MTGSSLLIKKNPLRGKASKVLIGWQEWCALPALHLPAIKAKIDTGAKTSALHASDIHPFHRQGKLYVHFTVQPIQRSHQFETRCTAKVIDERSIMNSGGHKELRYVIMTNIMMGLMTWPIEITLTNRDPMSFRMLLGRDALKDHSLIEPGKIFSQGKLTIKEIRKLYQSLHKDPNS